MWLSSKNEMARLLTTCDHCKTQNRDNRTLVGSNTQL